MFPAPTTIAISRPSERTSTISAAISSILCGSIPYSRSPMSASPETLSSTRRKIGVVPASADAESGASIDTSAAGEQRVTHELDDLEPALGQHLACRLRGLPRPRLVGEHAAGGLREEPLREHPLDDLRAHLL